MAERGAVAVAASGAPAARRCCGCGLARLVRRLRRQGRRALRARPAAAAARRLGCQYDPLSYARNFDLGRDADDAARLHYACSFSSRFVLVPAAASSAGAAVPAGPAPTPTNRPIASS